MPKNGIRVRFVYRQRTLPTRKNTRSYTIWQRTVPTKTRFVLRLGKELKLVVLRIRLRIYTHGILGKEPVLRSIRQRVAIHWANHNFNVREEFAPFILKFWVSCSFARIRGIRERKGFCWFSLRSRHKKTPTD
jgi:hypothetical protein